MICSLCNVPKPIFLLWSALITDVSWKLVFGCVAAVLNLVTFLTFWFDKVIHVVCVFVVSGSKWGGEAMKHWVCSGIDRVLLCRGRPSQVQKEIRQEWQRFLSFTIFEKC